MTCCSTCFDDGAILGLILGQLLLLLRWGFLLDGLLLNYVGFVLYQRRCDSLLLRFWKTCSCIEHIEVWGTAWVGTFISLLFVFSLLWLLSKWELSCVLEILAGWCLWHEGLRLIIRHPYWHLVEFVAISLKKLGAGVLIIELDQAGGLGVWGGLNWNFGGEVAV